MLIDAVIFILQLTAIGFLAALEWSVGVPIVSITLLFFCLRGHSSPWQLTFLVCSSLIISSFVMVAWSAVFILLAVSWILIEFLQKKFRWLHNKIFIGSFFVTVVLSVVARVTFDTRALVYSIALSALVYVFFWIFFHTKNRKKIIGWLSIGG